jgi:hippurate hydrolase
MAVSESIQALAEDARDWRRELHKTPELLYDVVQTAKFVADRLRAFGCDEVRTSVGRSGVVGIIKGRGGDGPAIALRADMDALPIEERTNLPYRSTIPGKMHACGHDGHTAMLLGAARHLAKTRSFRGTAVVVFQPAEEGGAGAKAMLEDGLVERFGVSQFFGMHNWPGLPLGTFAIRKGAILAAADKFTISLEGKGGHAAMPHHARDVIVAGSEIVLALQNLVSRETDPLDSAVVSVSKFEAGTVFNVLPQTATLLGTVRTLKPATRDHLEMRLGQIVSGVAGAHGIEAKTDYARGYPPTRNHDRETDFAASVAERVAGAESVTRDIAPSMGAEDFSYMLEAKPGAFILIGNGDSAGLHHPEYDFNDEALAPGMAYWTTLIETALAP